jgi:hypothetical protein
VTFPKVTVPPLVRLPPFAMERVKVPMLKVPRVWLMPAPEVARSVRISALPVTIVL